MNKITSTLLAIAFAGTLLAADSPPPDTKLSKEAEAAIAAAEASVQKNRAEYDKANQKALDATAKVLKSELDKLTKAGKLEEAMAVKKELEGFRVEVVGKVDGKALKGLNAADMLGDDAVDVAKAIIGKWKLTDKNVILAFSADKTCKWLEGSFVCNGSYSIKNGIANILWSNGNKDTFNVVKKTHIENTEGSGAAHTLEKL